MYVVFHCADYVFVMHVSVSFPIALIKCSDKKRLREKGFILAYTSRDIQSITERKTWQLAGRAWCRRGRLDSHTSLLRKWTEAELSSGSSSGDIFPPAKCHLLEVSQLFQIIPPCWDQVFKHTGICGPFLIQTTMDVLNSDGVWLSIFLSLSLLPCHIQNFIAKQMSWKFPVFFFKSKKYIVLNVIL